MDASRTVTRDVGRYSDEHGTFLFMVEEDYRPFPGWEFVSKGEYNPATGSLRMGDALYRVGPDGALNPVLVNPGGM